jgi:hypothetical protein
MSWCGVVQHEELPPSERTNPFADFDRMHALLGETQMLTDEKAHLSNTFWYDGVACGAREWAVCVVYVCVCVCVLCTRVLFCAPVFGSAPVSVRRCLCEQHSLYFTGRVLRCRSTSGGRVKWFTYDTSNVWFWKK